jgi:ribonuclease HII
MTVMGIDEVGRGCWAGPLVAGAVILPDNYTHDVKSVWRLTDSKRLSKQQREMAAEGIEEIALASGLGWVSNEEVDAIGLTASVKLAMERAIEAAGISTYQIIIDGSFNFLPHLPNTEAVVKADSKVPAVSAASILAKVARDNWMVEAAKRFPGYGFERHVGYGTAEHRQALAELGACKLHRMSYRPIQALA